MSEHTNFNLNSIKAKYNNLFSHHVKCIMESGLILDEDMQVILTYWDNNCIIMPKTFMKYKIATSCCCSVLIGLITSLHLKASLPLFMSIVPSLIYVCDDLYTRYIQKSYRKNFEYLIHNLRSLYEINRNIADYFCKLELSSESFCSKNSVQEFVTEPMKQFLHVIVLKMVTIMKMIAECIVQVSKAVAIPELQSEWNLEQFKLLKFGGDEISVNTIQRMNDTYILAVSSFLSCIGLSFCTNLWAREDCNFTIIFSDVIPSILFYISSYVSETEKQFNNFRFLVNFKGTQKLTKTIRPPIVPSTVTSPLTDFLIHLQITFQLAERLLQEIEKKDQEIPLIDISSYISNINNALTESADYFHHFERCPRLKPIKNTSCKKLEPPRIIDDTPQNTVRTKINADDPPAILEDEEYSLSLHGSDDDDEDSPEFTNSFQSDLSLQEIKFMIIELKKHLNDRVTQRNKAKNKNQQELENKLQTSSNNLEVDPIPLPPPVLNYTCKEEAAVSSYPEIDPPSSSSIQLPGDEKDDVRVNFLMAVRNIASHLNREENVYSTDCDCKI